MRNLLEYSGSLISNDSLIVAPYDYQKQSYENILPLNNGLIKNWNIQKFSSNYSEIEHLNVINGMGVTLGDSIVGISVLSAIKKKNPKIKIKIIRPETAPSYVEELYELASSVIDELHYMQRMAAAGLARMKARREAARQRKKDYYALPC